MRIPGLSVDVDLAGIEWRGTKVPGVAWCPLHLDDEPSAVASGTAKNGDEARRSNERGGAAVLIRMEPGAGYAPHRHIGSEDVLVLQGGYRDERGEYRRGDFVHYEPGSAHAPVALGVGDDPVSAENPACLLFAVASAGIELLR
jgi:anti-sigma factor ChrR (cupin superfamily)